MTKQKKHKKNEYVPHVPPEKAPLCDVRGCREAGCFKAPRSREALHDYRWFCLDHIREHNRKWDFFAGFDRDQIEQFIRDATTGHRPTWNRENGMRYTPQKLQDALYEFLNPGRPAPRARP